MAKLTAGDLKAMTAKELEELQLAVNGEVAVRVQNERLENRLVTALTDAQKVGFTDAEINTIFTRSKERVQKGKQDVDNSKQPATRLAPNPDEPKVLAKSQKEVTQALTTEADKAYKEAVKKLGDGDGNG